MKGSTVPQKAKQGFLARLIDKLDKKMLAKAKSKPCCGQETKSGEKSCCS